MTATLVRVAILADGVKKTEHEDKLLDVLRSVPEPEGGWDTGCDNYPAGNSSESRATCKAFVSHVLRSADAEPDRLQAIVDRATADAHGPPKGNPPRENGALHITRATRSATTSASQKPERGSRRTCPRTRRGRRK